MSLTFLATSDEKWEQSNEFGVNNVNSFENY